MAFNKIPFFSLLFTFALNIPSTATANEPANTDSVIIRALKDELYRSINQLHDKETGNPFFISYTYLDGEVAEASALLGALNSSNKYSSTSWGIRLMMGDYDVNDENFQDNFSREQTDNIPITRQPPIEPDYEGIRNTFWWNTGNVFQSAVRNYKSKLAALKDKPIAESHNLLPDFTRAEPVKIYRNSSTGMVSKEKLEIFVKDISNVFREYKEVSFSNVSAYQFKSNVYIFNTEGSEAVIPLNIITMDISASVYSPKGEVFRNSISFVGKSIEDFPMTDSIKNAVRALAKYLLELRQAEIINEKYTGPVLFEGKVASGIIAGCLFGNEKQFVADRDLLVNSLSKNMLPKNTYSRESKLEKRIVSKDITVKALSHLKEYKGIPLMGAFELDAECIVPPDEIVLVEKGILKNMFCDRIPTKNFRQSNGHNRIGLSYGGFTTGIAPGVILVESENRSDASALRQKIIESAIDRGLEYVIIVKPLIGGMCHSPYCFYKLDVNTGKEKLVYQMSLPAMELKYLNKITGTGSGTIVNNHVFNHSNYRSMASKSGFPASFITPDAMLVDEMELGPVFPYSDMDLPFYDNQLNNDE
ncbi:MAG: metallopeptidase TldD-related protein [Bacteroidales bacterium]